MGIVGLFTSVNPRLQVYQRMTEDGKLRLEQVADCMQNDRRCKSLVVKKAKIDLEKMKRKRNIEKLSSEVDRLSLKVEKAQLEEKWWVRRPGGREDAAEETLRLCKQLEEDPDDMESIIQELCIQQSKVTSQVNDLKLQLKELANG